MLKKILTYTLLTSLLLNTGCSTLQITPTYKNQIEKKTKQDSIANNSIDELIIQINENKSALKIKTQKESNEKETIIQEPVIEKKIIYINPGHGPAYRTKRNLGPQQTETGFFEFEANYIIAVLLKQKLDNDYRFDAKLIKEYREYSPDVLDFIRNEKNREEVKKRMQKIKHSKLIPVPVCKECTKGKKEKPHILPTDELIDAYLERIYVEKNKADLYINIHLEGNFPARKGTNVIVSCYNSSDENYYNTLEFAKAMIQEYGKRNQINKTGLFDDLSKAIRYKEVRPCNKEELINTGIFLRARLSIAGDKRYPASTISITAEKEVISHVYITDLKQLNSLADADYNAILRGFGYKSLNNKEPTIFDNLLDKYFQNKLNQYSSNNFINPQ